MSISHSAPSLEAIAHAELAQLMDALTLLHSAEDLAGGFDAPTQADGVTSPQSRLLALLAMSREKIAGTIRSLTPHV